MRLKHIAAFLLGTALTVSMIPAFVFAKEIDVKTVDRDVTQSTESGNGEEKGPLYEIPLKKVKVSGKSDNDELLDEYFKTKVKDKLYTRKQSYRKANMAGARLPSYTLYSYNALIPEIQKIAAGTSNSTEFVIPASELGLEGLIVTAQELGVSTIKGSDGKVTSEARTAIGNLNLIDGNALVDALLADLPYDLYWFDKTVYFRWSGPSYYAYSDRIEFTGDVRFLFPVSQDYAASADYETDPAKIGQVGAAINNAAQIVSDAKNSTDFDKLKYYFTQICSLNSYNHAAAGNSGTPYGDPWQLIWVFDGDPNTKVVCEGYSKAFMYLCDMTTFTSSNISCITVSGDCGGPHMWNVVKMDDGKNYHVDITNCDGDANGCAVGYPDKLFLVGYSQIVNGGYEFDCNGKTVKYIFDADTTKLYTTEQLDISTHNYLDTKYSLKLNTPVNGSASLSINGISQSNETNAYAGDEITVNYTANTGYELDSITVDGKAITGNKFTMSSKDVTVTVTFKKINYTITVSECTNGTATVENSTANYGDTITINITADDCYKLGTITVNGEYKASEFTMPASNITISVTFTADHKLVKTDAKEATCTEAGYEEYWSCSKCQKLFSDGQGNNKIDSPIVKPALGHKWDDGTVTDEATCTKNGTKHFVCTRDGCGKTTDETINALGHDLKKISEEPPKKNVDGHKAYYECNRCHKLFSDAEGNKEIDSPEVILGLPHDLTAVPAKAATCTEDGYKAHYECKDDDCGCGKKYEDKSGQNDVSDADIKVAALGHDPQAIDKKDPTCTCNGYEKHYKCSRCKKLFSDANAENEIAEPKAIAKLGHDLKHVAAKAETYKEDGNIEYYYCNRCKKYFMDPDCKNEIAKSAIVIPKKGSAVLNEEAPAGDNIYKVTNPATDGTGTVTLTRVVTKTSSVSIPSTVEIKGSIYKVVRIGYKAFYKNTTIKTLSIGSNVKYIDSYAFYGCKNLTKVSGGKNLLSIGTKAFAYCSKLKSFSISSAVLNKISPYTFQKDKKLKTITIKQTTKLTKAGVKKSLKGSKVKKIKVKKSKVKAYKKIFKKSNSGRSVKVKK